MNRENFLTLAEYLFTLPNDFEYFDMSQFAAIKNTNADSFCEFKQIIRFADLDKFNSCEICHCALGKAIGAGFKPIRKDRGWRDYCLRVFDIGFHSPEYSWCFGEEWKKSDNTPQGAAARIMYMLENGIPDDWVNQTKDLNHFMNIYENYKTQNKKDEK
jgi:hypothetical protein